MVQGPEPDDEGKHSITGVSDDDSTGASSARTQTGFERRSFLKLAGVAAAGTVGASSIGTAAAAADYEVWEMTSQEVYDLDDGEVLSNVLVDQTDPDGSLTIRSRNASDWEVRNVGFLGVGNNDGEGAYQFQISTPSGARGLVENVYLYGKDDPQGTELGGMLIRSSHGGHIDIRHTYIEGFGNNAVYGSNCHPDDGGNGGTVAIENAFHRDNTVSQFRLGTDGSYVRNSVGIISNPPSDDELRGNYYTSSDEFNARGVWSRWDGEVTVENCSLYVSGDDVQPDAAFNTSRGANLTIVDCDVNADAPQTTDECSSCDITVDGLGNTPTVDVIGDGGVPLSAEMAASGGRAMPTPDELPAPDSGSDDGSTTEPTLDRTLTIDGSGADRTDYTFTVSETIENNPDVGSFDSDDTIDGTTASGFVNGGTDGYLFTGEITDATVDGNATVLVDGEAVDFGDDSSGDSTPDRTLTIDGSGADRTDYEFTVTGSFEENPDVGSLGGGDKIDGDTASGFVNGGTDGYLFTGEITDATVDGNATILVDGEAVELDLIGLDRTLTVDGTDADRTDYEITVSGDIANDPDTGSLGTGDEIDGSTATGFVNGGVDGYRFSGELTDAVIDGDATVRIDDAELDEDRFNSAPTIAQYEVTEIGSPNAAANIIVQWHVQDVDGDLSGVTVDAIDESGTVVDSNTTSVAGESVYGVDYFEIDNADSAVFDVRLTVTDGAGATATESASVQE